MLKMNLRHLNLLFEFVLVKIVGFQQNVKISQNNAFDQIYDLIRGIIFVNRIMRVKEEVTLNETDQQLWVSQLRRIKRLEWSKSNAYYWNKELRNNKWKIIVNSTTTCNTMNCYFYHRAFVSLNLWKLRQVFTSAVYDEWRRGSNIYRYFFDYSDVKRKISRQSCFH